MNDLITPKLDQPRLWIERVEIYGSIAPPELIRGIDFYKGLNVIWGVPNPERKTDDDFGIEFNGHSVGKTSLCRLIRYALGESSFGRKILEKRINSTFQKNGGGAVAMLVHVDGVRWSIIRPFIQIKDSKAARNLSIEELFSAAHEDNPYGNFEKALHEAFIEPLPAKNPPGTKKEYLWSHLLAWLTRDQEARFQSIWQWRSPRSETLGAPKFSAPKQAAQHLMRTVLALLDKEEAGIFKEIDDCQEELNELKSARDSLTKSHKEKATFLESVLVAYLPQEEQARVDLNDYSLLGLDYALGTHLDRLNEEIADLSRKREENQKELVFFQAEVSSYEKEIERVKADLAPLRDSETKPAGSSSEEQEKQKKMENLLEGERKCHWSGRPFFNCEYYKESLQRLREKFSSLGRALTEIPDNSERNLAYEKLITDEFKYTEELKEARKQVKALSEKERSITASITKKEGEISSINANKKSLEDSKAFAKGILPQDTATELPKGDDDQSEDVLKIRELNGTIKEKGQVLEELKKQLSNSQGKSWDQGVILKNLYGRILKSVLSPKLDAHITLPPKHDIHFGIQESTAVLAGEAVESLSLILFDITAVLWSVEGNGSHPCFLLHDSPREADLEAPVYNQFLANIHALSKRLGGKDAPFQYIVTTTTEPPQNLQDDGIIRESLSAHPPENMLFRKVLEAPALFDEENEIEQSGETDEFDDSDDL